MKKEEKGSKHRYGTLNFEKRKHPRLNVDLPIEYARNDLVVSHGETLNASEGGSLIYLPEKMEVGQHLSLKLSFSPGFELNTIETLVQVVWTDIHPGEEQGETIEPESSLSISCRGTRKN